MIDGEEDYNPYLDRDNLLAKLNILQWSKDGSMYWVNLKAALLLKDPEWFKEFVDF